MHLGQFLYIHVWWADQNLHVGNRAHYIPGHMCQLVQVTSFGRNVKLQSCYILTRHQSTN
ncbi:hypothetical protein BLOT_016092 [Blomia tropicalis]|nr:hypothetical protein BLOT_016092 [Blomia tropicalis]